jgi:transglutaminase-like putative cysteine protease
MVGLTRIKMNISTGRMLLVYLALISIHAKLFAQELNSLSKQYPDELAIYLNKKKTIFLDIQADTLTINTENFSEMIYLKDNANILSEKEIYYSGMLKVTDVEAKCMIPKGDGGMKTIKVTEFIDEDVQERGIFFNDSKVKKFIYPSLQKGAKSSLFYKETYLEPRLFGPFFFSAEALSLNSELSITYNNKIDIGYKVLGIDETALEKSEVKKGSKIITTWKMKNVPRLERDANAPNVRYYAPQIIVYIKSLKLKNGTVNYSSNYKDLYQWTYKLVKGINKDSEKEIKGLVDSLLVGAKTDLEKSKRIFYWVQDNIRYIAFEDGYGGFIPRDAEKVYKKRYGDCKDMANITSYMHKLAGIPAYLTLIGSRDIPYAVSEIPSSCNFNHMIATVKLDDRYYFLDATGKYQLHGQPTSMIQDKEGLIVMGKDSCMVRKKQFERKRKEIY